MYENLKDEKLIVEIAALINSAEELEEEVDMYCQFMKGMFLATSGLN